MGVYEKEGLFTHHYEVLNWTEAWIEFTNDSDDHLDIHDLLALALGREPEDSNPGSDDTDAMPSVYRLKIQLQVEDVTKEEALRYLKERRDWTPEIARQRKEARNEELQKMWATRVSR